MLGNQSHLKEEECNDGGSEEARLMISNELKVEEKGLSEQMPPPKDLSPEKLDKNSQITQSNK